MPKFCSKCGTEAIEGDTFCSKCGFNLKENIMAIKSSEAISTITVKITSPTIAETLIFGIGLLAIGIIGYLYTQPEIEKLESLLGSLGRVLSSNLKNKYEILKLLNIASVMSIVIGGLVIFWRFIATLVTVKRQ